MRENGAFEIHYRVLSQNPRGSFEDPRGTFEKYENQKIRTFQLSKTSKILKSVE